MAGYVNVRAYAELNDFLGPESRGLTVRRPFRSHQTVKDVLEAMGIPHTEVDLILVDGDAGDFAHRPTAGDRIAVYPMFEALDIGSTTRLRPVPLRDPRFVIDVNLGRLARLLRVLGFDVWWSSDADDRTLAEYRKRLPAADPADPRPCSAEASRHHPWPLRPRRPPRGADARGDTATGPATTAGAVHTVRAVQRQAHPRYQGRGDLRPRAVDPPYYGDFSRCARSAGGSTGPAHITQGWSALSRDSGTSSDRRLAVSSGGRFEPVMVPRCPPHASQGLLFRARSGLIHTWFTWCLLVERR